MLATVQNGPCDAAGVLALEEQRLRLAVLEAEDLAVTTDVDFTLSHEETTISLQIFSNVPAVMPRSLSPYPDPILRFPLLYPSRDRHVGRRRQLRGHRSRGTAGENVLTLPG